MGGRCVADTFCPARGEGRSARMRAYGGTVQRGRDTGPLCAAELPAAGAADAGAETRHCFCRHSLSILRSEIPSTRCLGEASGCNFDARLRWSGAAGPHLCDLQERLRARGCALCACGSTRARSARMFISIAGSASGCGTDCDTDIACRNICHMTSSVYGNVERELSGKMGSSARWCRSQPLVQQRAVRTNPTRSPPPCFSYKAVGGPGGEREAVNNNITSLCPKDCERAAKRRFTRLASSVLCWMFGAVAVGSVRRCPELRERHVSKRRAVAGSRRTVWCFLVALSLCVCVARSKVLAEPRYTSAADGASTGPSVTWHVSKAGQDSSGCGGSAGSAACATLAAVLSKGVAALEGSTVVIEPATAAYSCPASTIMANMTIQSASTEQTVVFDCEGARSWVEFRGERGATRVAIEGLEIRRCYAMDAGGCLRTQDVAVLSVLKSSFSECYAAGGGACIRVYFGAKVATAQVLFHSLSIADAVSGPNTTHATPGAVSIEFAEAMNRSSVVFGGDTECKRAAAKSGGGGCVSVYYSADVSNSALLFTGNVTMQSCSSAKYGGCVSVYFNGAASNTSLTFHGNTVMDECRARIAGGCVSVYHSGISRGSSLWFSGSTVMSGCSASAEGGCVALYYTDSSNSSFGFRGTTRISNCSVTADGGCVSVFYAGTSDRSLSSFSGSTAIFNCSSQGYGGCVSFYYGEASSSSAFSFSGTTAMWNCFSRNGAGGCVAVAHNGLSIGSNTSFSGATTMSNCSSGGFGGCVSVYYASSARNSSSLFRGITTFSNCSSGGLGGCASVFHIAPSENSMLAFRDVTRMTNCSSSADGGCVSLYYSENSSNSGVSFSGITSMANCLSLQSGGCVSLAWTGRTVEGVHASLSNVSVDSSSSQERGGAISLTSGAENWKSILFLLQNISITQSKAIAPSSYGGAISVQCASDRPKQIAEQRLAQWTHSCTAIMHNVSLLQVQSDYGGGIYVSNGLHQYSRVHVVSGTGRRSGGAFHIEGTASLACASCEFRNCSSTSAGASAVLMASKGPLALSDVAVHPPAQTGSVVQALVAVNISVQSLSVSCPAGYSYAQASTVLTQASFPWVRQSPLCCEYQSYQSACTACPKNMYALAGGSTSHPNVSCTPVPYGAQSSGAANIEARPGYWGTPYPTSDMIAMYFCPEGYCCPGPETCSPVSYCHDNRAGVLCGSCKVGYTQLYSAVGCAPDATCGQTWYYPVAVVFALALALYVLYWNSNSTSGMTGVMVNFYQLVPFFLVSVTESDLWERGVSDFFNLRVPFFHAGDTPVGEHKTGLCPIVGLGAVGKMVLHLFVPVLLAVVLAVLYIVQSQMGKRKGVSERYILASLRLVMLAYVSVLESTFSLLHCVPVMGEARLFLAGDIVCYQSWQVFLFFVVIILYAFPFLFLWWQRVYARKMPDRVRAAVQGKYRPGCSYWECVILVRRLLIVSVFAFEVDVFTRLMVLAVLSVANLLIHERMKPFKCQMTNIFDGVVHFGLCVVAIINVRNAGFVEDATIPEGPSAATSDQLITAQSVMILLPLALYCAWMAIKYGGRWIRRFRRWRANLHGRGTEEQPQQRSERRWAEMSAALLK